MVVGGVGGWKILCIKINYSEPRVAESQEERSRRRELSRDVMLDSDWLTTWVT